ncbi:MAG: dTDP-4-dehydrorhamnose reductase [Solirubrobacterales bacterium]|nr:dTDP-4-dehydrorhamnose reductase [Solirubrobacterales bacterium]
MRILVTGSAGMLGGDVCGAAAGAGHRVIALSHAELDITDADAVATAVIAAAPDAVVNCAAWTDVDGAEGQEGAARAVNGQGAGNVARAAAVAGAWTIHISSDYVFDGRKRGPYLESDPAGPLSAYGRSKLAGEQAVAAHAPAAHTVVRSSWLFGTRGPCFPATIGRLAGERDELTVVDDQVGCPTFTGHLARALTALATQPSLGLVHVAGAGWCSWFDFAREVVSSAGLECEIKPGRTADLERPAARPLYSVLGTERPSEAPKLPDWREGLAEYLAAGVSAV